MIFPDNMEKEKEPVESQNKFCGSFDMIILTEKRVIQGSLWHGSQNEDHRYKNVLPASWACERGRKWSSLTQNGEPGFRCQFHTLSRESVFLFLPDSVTVFPPSHPLVSYCLEFSWKCINIWAVFSPVVDSNSVITLLLHYRVADKMHSVCEKFHFPKSWT